jgi:hypothetical protein
MIFSVVVVALMRMLLAGSHSHITGGYKLIAGHREKRFLQANQHRPTNSNSGLQIFPVANCLLEWWESSFGQDRFYL